MEKAKDLQSNPGLPLHRSRAACSQSRPDYISLPHKKQLQNGVSAALSRMFELLLANLPASRGLLGVHRRADGRDFVPARYYFHLVALQGTQFHHVVQVIVQQI